MQYLSEHTPRKYQYRSSILQEDIHPIYCHGDCERGTDISKKYCSGNPLSKTRDIVVSGIFNSTICVVISNRCIFFLHLLLICIIIAHKSPNNGLGAGQTHSIVPVPESESDSQNRHRLGEEMAS